MHWRWSDPILLVLRFGRNYLKSDQNYFIQTWDQSSYALSKAVSFNLLFLLISISTINEYINHYMISIQHSSSSSKIQSYFFKVRCKFHQNISSPLRTGLKIIEDFCQQTNSDETISSDTLPRSSTMSHSIVYVVLQVCKQCPMFLFVKDSWEHWHPTWRISRRRQSPLNALNAMSIER